MARGKQTCKILKEIRRQIAEANDIKFVTSECRIYWDDVEGLQDDDGKPLKEATLRIEAEVYDPVTIKVKYPKRNAKKTIRFKHKIKS